LPAKSTKHRAALLLTPGAGADRDQATLVALDEAVSARGIPVDRLDFPYRKAGRRAPDRAPVLIAAVNQAAADLARRAKVGLGDVFLGGRSMGGRMCSMAVAEGLPARGLVLISYPLHPPGKPETLRTQHFPALEVPCLFVSGTRDAFGTPDELTDATAGIPAPVTHVWLEGGDHGLRGRDEKIVAAVGEWIAQILG
jgi:predicted alpha/beta-hydrolase family hydrolase